MRVCCCFVSIDVRFSLVPSFVLRQLICLSACSLRVCNMQTDGIMSASNNIW